MDHVVSSLILILAIGLGMPSFLALVDGHEPRTVIASVATTTGTSATFAGIGMAFQNYEYRQAALFLLLSALVCVATMGVASKIGRMSLMPFIAIACLLSYRSAI